MKIPATVVLTAFGLVLATPAQSGDPQSPRRAAATALREFLAATDADIDAFADRHLAESLLDERPWAEIRSALAALRETIGKARLIEMGPEGDVGMRLLFAAAQREIEVRFALEPAPPHRFANVWIDDGPHLSTPPPIRALPGPLTWENLDARVTAEADAGLAGAVLVVRDGERVCERGFGFADRDAKIANRSDTIFAIGSTPIDFTKAGILLLVERGELKLDAPITRFFDAVPDDKRDITIEHLMTGGSGLRDFHDLPTDGDPDHAWIDRPEAVRRILAQELLFPPGKGRQHSHSAWGLLAAVLEIVSGQDYPAFTRQHLFAPAGMADTGFFGDRLPKERVAIGYGERSDGEVNAPTHWGRTSWLVMGSGGMVSTLGDLYRWNQALRAGRLLSEDSLRRYWSAPGDLLNGGDVYGFETFYTEGPDSLMFLASNNIDGARRRTIQTLARDLAKLVDAARREAKKR